MNFYELLFNRGQSSGEGMTNFEHLFAAKLAGGEIKELEGIPPLTFTANGQPLLDYLISGNEEHTGTPTPDSPIMPQGTGDLETSGAKAGQYKIPISSASTTTPVYLGEVETTRKIKKYEFTGQESIVADPSYSRFIFILNGSLIIGVRKTPAFCTHWQVIDDGRTIANVPNNALYSDSGSSRWFVKTTDYTTAGDFKAYLAAQYAAGTPVTIWYVLATEETAVVNEPLIRIDDYADTLSKAQAGVEIPTASGSTTLDIDTTIKPSNVYIKYKS